MIDPDSEIKHVESVLVSYPSRPLVCTACNSLGHLIGACPKVTRQWVKKQRPIDTPIAEVHNTNTNPSTDNCSTPPGVPTAVEVQHDSTKQEEWHTVVGKKKPRSPKVDSPGESPTPLNTFKNLAMVDEVDVKRAAALSTSTSHLSKSQRKKLKQASKKASPLLP